ncbi:MAG: GNAT family N-acetyltransferase [Pseudomonadota bacterium]
MKGATLDIELRLATENDADILATLMAEMDDEESAPAHASDSASVKAVLADMAQYPNFRAYLVFENKVAVASFTLMIFSSPSHHGAPQAMLDAVVVTPARRGAGIGETMIERALAIATEAGCYKMMLSSNLKRMDAHRFYERIGFTQHGISFAIALS